MESRVERIAAIPIIGLPIAAQILAVDTALDLRGRPRRRVANVYENDVGVAIILEQLADDGKTWTGGFPTNLICIAKGNEPRLVLDNTGHGLIRSHRHFPLGELLNLVVGMPTLVVLSPVILTVRIGMLCIGLVERMNVRAALTYLSIREQLEPPVRDLLERAFQNDRKGASIERMPFDMRIELGPNHVINL